MEDQNAKIIVGASEVAGGRRHLYLLFQRSDGSQIVVRGGPDARAEGNDLANFAESTLLGTKKFGHIVVDAAPYVPPYEAALQRQSDGSFRPIPRDRVDPADPALARDPQGRLITQTITAPDWQFPGQHHERAVAWQGSDSELEGKLQAALRTGAQINAAQLEYSPLSNNSNGVVGNLMEAAGVRPVLPSGADGKAVQAPNFGEDLYQDVGMASARGGYRLDGAQWYSEDDRKIAPPRAGEPIVPLEPAPQRNRGSSGGFETSQTPPMPGDETLLAQIRDGVGRIDASLGRPPDEASERMTASLYALAKQQGMDRVDQVVLGNAGTRAAQGEYIFLVKGDPATSIYQREQMKTADAVAAPVEQSLARAQEIGRDQSREMVDSRRQQEMETPAPSLRV
jgi:hypothetical protein